MKKILSLVFLVYFSGKIIAQEYHPFSEDSATWYEQYDEWNPDNGQHTVSLHYHKIVGDTVINGISHIKLINHYGYPEFFYQDSATKKVYYTFYNGFNYIDTLIYNFSLGVGDKLKDIWFASGIYNPFRIGSIDSILLENGEYRRRLNIVDSLGDLLPVAWIEGIGSTGALFGYPYFFYTSNNPFRNTLICHNVNDTLLYSISNSVGNCESIISNVTVIPYTFDIKIYPNPVYKESNITISGLAERSTIAIYNCVGKEVYSIMSSESQLIINVQRLSLRGYFIVRIRDRQGNISNYKLIIF